MAKRRSEHKAPVTDPNTRLRESFLNSCFFRFGANSGTINGATLHGVLLGTISLHNFDGDSCWGVFPVTILMGTIVGDYFWGLFLGTISGHNFDGDYCWGLFPVTILIGTIAGSYFRSQF